MSSKALRCISVSVVILGLAGSSAAGWAQDNGYIPPDKYKKQDIYDHHDEERELGREANAAIKRAYDAADRGDMRSACDLANEALVKLELSGGNSFSHIDKHVDAWCAAADKPAPKSS